MQQNGRKVPDYSYFVCERSRRRKEAVLRVSAGQALTIANTIKMSGGFPNPATFPLVKTTFTLRDGIEMTVDGKSLETHLQYGMSHGYEELYEQLITLQKRVHNPPTMSLDNSPAQFRLAITNGSNEAVNLILELVVGEGNWALSEEATYATMFSMIEPQGGKVHGIKADDQGILPEDLDLVLRSWDDLHPGTSKPRLLYVVPTSGNPTGVTWSLARKKAVYAIAQTHDLLILEDDAYYFLQFQRPLVPSFLSLDVDGRVLRCDTVSKIISPGLRVGYISGPSALVNKILIIKDVGSLGPSGLSQIFLLEILKQWGYEGFVKHVDSIMEFYKKQRDMVLMIAEKYLTGLAEWAPPSGGLFLWLKVKGVKDSKAIVRKALDRKLITVAGTYMTPGFCDSPYIRLSFSVITSDECEKAFKILAEVIKEEVKNN